MNLLQPHTTNNTVSKKHDFIQTLYYGFDLFTNLAENYVPACIVPFLLFPVWT